VESLNDKFIAPVLNPNPGNNFFQAGIGCGDDIHVFDLVTEYGYPFLHMGYFYLPYSEYYLCGKRNHYTSYIIGDEETGYGIVKINNVELPDSDLPPVITLFSGEPDYDGIVTAEQEESYHSLVEMPNNILNTRMIYQSSQYKSKKNNLSYNTLTGKFHIDQDVQYEINPKPYNEPIPYHYGTVLDGTPYIKTYEPPINIIENVPVQITPTIFRKVTDLTGRRTYNKIWDETFEPYVFELQEMEYILDVSYSGDYADLTFYFNSGHIGEAVEIEYNTSEFLMDNKHPLNPKITPQYAGRFLSITDEDQNVAQIILNHVEVVQALPEKPCQIIASAYDSFGAPIPDIEISFVANFPVGANTTGENAGYFVTPFGDAETCVATTTLDGTCSIHYKPPDYLSPRGVNIIASSQGKTGGSINIKTGSFYRKKNQSYWFQCDLSTFDCRAARCAIGVGFFSSYGKMYNCLKKYGSMGADLSQHFMLFSPLDYTEYPEIFQEFGRDDNFIEETHAIDDRRSEQTEKTIHGLYGRSKKFRFGSGVAAPQYTYYQAYNRPPIPYVDPITLQWVFPSTLYAWYDRKSDPDPTEPLNIEKVKQAELDGIWTIFDYYYYKYYYNPPGPIDCPPIEDFIKEIYVTKDGMWGNELRVKIENGKTVYNVHYTPVLSTVKDAINRGQALKLFDDSIVTLDEMLSESALWDKRSSSSRDSYHTTSL